MLCREAIGAAKGKQTKTMASCQPPPPEIAGPLGPYCTLGKSPSSLLTKSSIEQGQVSGWVASCQSFDCRLCYASFTQGLLRCP